MSTWQDVTKAVEEFREYLNPDIFQTFNTEEPITLDKIWAKGMYFPGAEYVGVYCIFGEDGTLLYVGKASANSSIGRRLSTYFKSDPNDKKKRDMSDDDKWEMPPYAIAAICMDSYNSGGGTPKLAWLAPALEEFLITKFSPPDNTMQKQQ